MQTVVVMGTLDTKGAELKYVQEIIAESGLDTLLVDTGVLGNPTIKADISREEVAKAGGQDLSQLVQREDRGEAITVMTAGAAKIARQLYDQGKLQGIISLGGSAGTTIGTSAMRALPVGVPKVMVSTLASGDTRPYVGTKDICMLYSVVDIAGLNRLSKTILGNAARAIAGMVTNAREEAVDEKPLIGATMFGVTTPCVTKAREYLESRGFEVLVFHATGTGGRAMEDLIYDGFITGSLDITTTEWCDELVGGVLNAGPHRLEAAGKVGIPQVVSLGALDMVNFGPMETVPEKFRHRRLYKHNPTVTLMRTEPEECAQLGRIIAEKLNAAKGPTALVIPLKGVSLIDREGQPFWHPEADQALFNTIRENIGPNVNLIELDTDINDPEFALTLAKLLEEMMSKEKGGN
ncbi:MAG: Tm-1-like ATP-binding domain-containing protein [bacterium]